jgi:hypothetical protein
MFCVDDTANQPLSDAYGVVLGSSHTGISTLSFLIFVMVADREMKNQ